MEKLIKNHPVNFTLAGLVVFLIAIIAFVFNVSSVYEQVNYNTENISVIKQEVKKIPIIETKLDFIVRGMEQLTDTKLK